MSTYLHRREGGTYYFRRAIPESVRAVAGRREWISSLGTKSLAEAKRRLPSRMIEANAEEAAWREGSPPPAGDMAASPAALGPQPASTPAKARDIIPQPAPSKSVPALLDLFDQYATQQCIKPATTNEWRSILTKLVVFLGHGDVRRISALDLDRWRDALLAEKTKRGGARDPRTVRDKYLCAVRATLNWSVEQRFITDNPALSVTVRAPKKRQLRSRDFTLQEARAILSAAIRPAEAGVSAEQALARRWIPWLCAYTGARVNELTQLRGEDVCKIDGIWALRITPEAGTVKNNSARLVPLHEDIISQGFLRIVNLEKSTPIFFDHAKIRVAGPQNRYPKKIGERLASWIRADVGINDPGIHPNHAWRHTFKTLSIAADIQERVVNYIMGHAPHRAADGYGSVPLRAALKALNTIDFSDYKKLARRPPPS